MYERVGSYGGSLREMADRFLGFDVQWNPTGYGTARQLVSESYAAEIGDAFGGEWLSSMLVVLRPGGNIGMHVDVPEAEGLTRYHLVLSTNDRCWSHHDGDWQQLEAGGIYAVDPARLHASINWGESMRVHLVADVVPARVPVLGGSI